MSRITKQQISRYRKTIVQKVRQIDKLARRSLYSDFLIRGTPGQVYRRCGKSNCRCAQGNESRHGPYKVISVVKDGKQKQISLRKEQIELWQLAVHYQFQMKVLSNLKKEFGELIVIINEIVEKRLKEFPNDEQ